MGKRHSLLLGALLTFSCATLWVLADPPAAPAWWTDTGNQTAILNGNTSNNYAPVTIGQLKNVAVKAQAYLDQQLSMSGNAGPDIDGMVNAFVLDTPANSAPATIGQLKYIAQPFYDRLLAVGYDTKANLASRITDGWAYNYPWPTPPPGPDQTGYNLGNYTAWLQQEYALANLGQVKLTFSFSLDGFTPTGGNLSGNTVGPVKGPTTAAYAGRLLTHPSDGGAMTTGPYPSAFTTWASGYPLLDSTDPNLGGEDYDGDGLTNYEEFLLGTDPTSVDTDSDGVPDGDGYSSQLDALPADGNFTMAAAPVPSYASFQIDTGIMLDMGKTGDVLIEHSSDGAPNYFTLWHDGLYVIPGCTTYLDGYDTSNEFVWLRVADDGRVVGSQNGVHRSVHDEVDTELPLSNT